MKELGNGIAWMGFWIGLGLYNFQGCTPQVKEGVEIYRESKVSSGPGSYGIRKR